MPDHGHFSSYEGHKKRQTGKIMWGFFKDAQGFRQLDAGSRAGFTSSWPPQPTMDLGISVFLIFVRCVALTNLDL